MRDITHIVIHHSASPRYTPTEMIRKWHMERGWPDIGYHILVEGKGAVVMGRSLEIPGAHVRGHNQNTLGICVIGDNTKDSRRWEPEQVKSLRSVLELLAVPFPTAVVLGHRDMPDTATKCPGLDVRELLELPPL